MLDHGPPIVIDTLAKAIQYEMEYTAHCQRCTHMVDLDLPAIVAKLGGDLPAVGGQLESRLVCGACGGKAISIIVSSKQSRRHIGTSSQ